MQVLNDFKQIKIEDILPFFPNFVTIDHFKVLLVHTLVALLQDCLSVGSDGQSLTDSSS